MKFSLRKARFEVQKAEHGVALAVFAGKAVAQHHVAAALAVHRAFRGEGAHAGEEVRVCGEAPGVKLRVAAGQPDCIGGAGRRFIGQRREGKNLRARVPPGFDKMWINEGKGGVLSQRNPLAGRSQPFAPHAVSGRGT